MNQETADNNYLKYKVINFENKFAIMQNETFGEINWPIKKLPDNVKIGDIYYIGIVQPSNEQVYTEENQILKNLLQELIQ